MKRNEEGKRVRLNPCELSFEMVDEIYNKKDA